MPHSDSDPDPALVAREIIDANQYLTLATADGDGHPWATPVWFAHDGYRDFLWVSRPESRHSRNIAARPEIAVAIFDSTVPAGTGKAVYAEALAAELDGPERDRAIAIFTRRSEVNGAGRWSPADVAAPAQFRLYRARASAHFVLDDHDRRVPVDPGL